jgi:cation transport ATPase
MALGARGAAASAEAADVVLLVDQIGRIAPAISISRRARTIALQSVWVGLGLSGLGMVAAAFGYLTPVQGALIQEAIDVAVILNALRALADPPRAT